VNSKKENFYGFCPKYVQEFGLRKRKEVCLAVSSVLCSVCPIGIQLALSAFILQFRLHFQLSVCPFSFQFVIPAFSLPFQLSVFPFSFQFAHSAFSFQFALLDFRLLMWNSLS
jgi:hypothetical protein